MTLATFFKKFDQFADAPDAVAKMRELVRNLAVSGELVPQDPDDEPAEEMLARIAEDIANAVRAKRMRNSRPIPAYEDEFPFDLPVGWAWAPLGNLTAAEDGAMCDGPFGSKLKTEHYIPTKGYSVLRLGNIGVGYFIHGKEGHISREHFESLPSNHAAPGDLLVAGLAVPLVRCCEIPPDIGPAVNKSDCFRVRLSKHMDRSYVRHYLNSRVARAFAAEENHGMTRERINLANAKALPVSVPPLAEQKRIVAKVDELMALCDRLALQQQERETRHAALARASLARFADAPTPANLHFLFHKSYTIPPADLRKSILTLAVQGKLVPQDPNDEPAETILRDTCSLFVRLVAVKKLSAPKPLPPVSDDEVPFSLPIGWAWCRFGQIMRISSGDGLVAKDMNAGPIPVYGGNGVNGYHDAYNVAKRTLVIGRVGFYCGSIHVTPERAWVTDNAFITTFDEEHFDMDFLSWLLKATDLRERDNATAQPVISGGKVYPTVLALPPLAEQRRIVAKVEQLMALVDALEQQLAASRATAANLLSALVAELTGTPNNGKVSVPSASGIGRRGRPPKSP